MIQTNPYDPKEKTERNQEIIRLRDVERYPFAEIARKLNMSRQNVNRIYYAYMKKRKKKK